MWKKGGAQEELEKSRNLTLKSTVPNTPGFGMLNYKSALGSSPGDAKIAENLKAR